MSYKILIIAGEASSDLHTSNLVKEIKKIRPDITFYGLGGNRMKEEGIEVIYNIVDLAVIGFVEVIRHYSLFKKIFYKLLDRAKSDRPNLIILVDYPGFNLRFAQKIKKLNIPIIYYISPQVWAWGKGRIKAIKRLINKMLVIFKFEETLYKNEGINVSFTGHPLLDIIPTSFDKMKLLKELNISPGNKIVALMPGSRETEVRKILPIMLETTSIIYDRLKGVNFIIIKSQALRDKLYEELIKESKVSVKIVEGKNYEVINASDLVLVASGTATLETALLKRPMIIIYKVAFLTYLFSKMLIKLPYIGMVNIVAGKKIIKEFLQYNTNPKDIAGEAISILSNPSIWNKITEDLSKIRDCLGEPGATKRAAGVIADFIKSC